MPAMLAMPIKSHARTISHFLVLFVISFAGCGSNGNSNTNATLLLSDPAVKDLGGGLINITATAVFSKAVPGVKINFTGRHFDRNNVTIDLITREIPTDATGSAQTVFNAGETTEITYFEVTASTGGLFRSKTLTIAVAPP